jgi:hypothetical protein
MVVFLSAPRFLAAHPLRLYHHSSVSSRDMRVFLALGGEAKPIDFRGRMAYNGVAIGM